VSHGLPFATVMTEALLLFFVSWEFETESAHLMPRRTYIGNPLGSQRRSHCSIVGRAKAAKKQKGLNLKVMYPIGLLFSKVSSQRCGQQVSE
jgi:hypothetical protein